jgi:outer membrane protein assembly factor BamB
MTQQQYPAAQYPAAQHPAQHCPPVPAPAPRRRTGVYAALAVVLAMIGAGTAVVVARFVGGSAQGGSGMAVAWSLPYSGEYNVADRDTERLHASWLVGDAVIRAQSDGVIAYAVADGAQLWGLPVPAGKTVCTASLTAPTGVALIAYGAAKGCDTVAGVDLTTGALTFSAKIAVPEVTGRQTPEPPMINQADGGIAVVRAEKVITGFDLATGRTRWTRRAEKGCYLQDDLGTTGDTTLISQGCGYRTPDRLIALNAATGAVRWNTPLPTGRLTTEIISARPAVIKMITAAEGTYVSFDDHGVKLAEIPEKVDGMLLDNREIGLELRKGQPRYRMWAVGTTLFTPVLTKGDSDEGQVAAFDLTTGKLRWRSTGHRSDFVLVRADEQEVLGFEQGGYKIKPRLARIAPDTGHVSTVREAAAADLPMISSNADLWERDGLLLVLPVAQEREAPAILALR